jgi:hypothetical protein
MSTPNASEATSRGHGRSQYATRSRSHRRKHDRVFDAESFGKSGSNSHNVLHLERGAEYTPGC